MELKEMARGHLKVVHQGMEATIYGEAFLRVPGSVDFVLYENSIKNWNNSEATPISLVQKNEILDFLKEEFSRRKLSLEIE
jgi:Immunity protein 74